MGNKTEGDITLLPTLTKILSFHKQINHKDIKDELTNSWIEISLKNLRNNLKYLQSKLQPETCLMAVVKADAYGHGYVEIARYAERTGVRYLGVASVLEGKLLRDAGIKIPVLVLGSVFPEQLETAFRYNLETILASTDNIRDTQKAAAASGLTASVHLKIDTGMGRVGIRPEKLNKTLELIKKADNIKLNGVFTHFAEAENQNGEYTLKQVKSFNQALDTIRQKGFVNFITHAANSSAVLLYPEAHFDMVRTGIAMYGYPDPPDRHLKPVLSLKSRIVNIKEMPAGSYLGYCRTFKTKRKSIIGIIPLGYADGLPRKISNRQDVIVKGVRCPLAGNISMDQCLVDLTDVPGVKSGEEVVLIGKSGKERITAREWAEKAGTITYEILCSFGNRLPRIYRE